MTQAFFPHIVTKMEMLAIQYQARSCPYAKNQLLAHHFGKKKFFLLALKNIITDMGRIPLFQYN